MLVVRVVARTHTVRVIGSVVRTPRPVVRVQGRCRCAHDLVATRHRVLLSRHRTLCRDMGILPMGKLCRDTEFLCRNRNPNHNLTYRDKEKPCCNRELLVATQKARSRPKPVAIEGHCRDTGPGNFVTRAS